MAGEIRQPIDIKALEKFIDANVPELKTPLEVKQVCTIPHAAYKARSDVHGEYSSAMASRILHIS